MAASIWTRNRSRPVNWPTGWQPSLMPKASSLVTLRADKGLDYGHVMGVMGELNRAGFTSISLVTIASAAEPGVSGADVSARSDTAP